MGDIKKRVRNVAVGTFANGNEFLGYIGVDKRRHKIGKFRCSCGNEFIGRASRIIKGETQSCGCAGKDYYKKGEIINGFEFIEYVEFINKMYQRAAHYKCFCGNVFWSKCLRVSKGLSKGCGCIVRKSGRIKMGLEPRYGVKADLEKKSWEAAKNRCVNPNSIGYSRYGNSGISMCDEWLNDFAVFFIDMGKRPTPKHTLDRIDNSKGYSKDNCRWATSKEQANNRTNNVIIDIDGIKKTVAQWCAIHDIKQATVYSRLGRGVNGKDAILNPVIKKRIKPYNNEKTSI